MDTVTAMQGSVYARKVGLVRIVGRINAINTQTYARITASAAIRCVSVTPISGDTIVPVLPTTVPTFAKAMVHVLTECAHVTTVTKEVIAVS